MYYECKTWLLGATLTLNTTVTLDAGGQAAPEGCIGVDEELTWAECIAGDLLHRHALTKRSSVQRSRVSAGPRSLLNSSPTVHATRRPLCPERPSTVHCREKEIFRWIRQQLNLRDNLSLTLPQKHSEVRMTNRLKENLLLHLWFDFWYVLAAQPVILPII